MKAKDVKLSHPQYGTVRLGDLSQSIKCKLIIQLMQENQLLRKKLETVEKS